MYIKDCAHCALPSINGGVCPVFRTKPKDPKDSCPMFQEKIEYCEICGQPILSGLAIIGVNGDSYHQMCADCASKTGTCATCKMRKTCEFETNPSTIPKVVQQTIQQGPATMVTQVRNPARVDLFCKSCSCYNEEFGCLKENGCCGNYKIIYSEEKEIMEVE